MAKDTRKDTRIEKYATALRNFSTDSSISFSQEQRMTVSDIADYIQKSNSNKSFWSIFSFFSIFSVSEWAWWVKTYVLAVVFLVAAIYLAMGPVPALLMASFGSFLTVIYKWVTWTNW